MLHHEKLLALQGAHFEEGKVLVHQRWAWWRRSRSSAVCAAFAGKFALHFSPRERNRYIFGGFFYCRLLVLCRKKFFLISRIEKVITRVVVFECRRSVLAPLPAALAHERPERRARAPALYSRHNPRSRRSAAPLTNFIHAYFSTPHPYASRAAPLR